MTITAPPTELEALTVQYKILEEAHIRRDGQVDELFESIGRLNTINDALIFYIKHLEKERA